ncbi:MAG: aminotransferase class I/II-fold pyridoxal phosphate-dependent enzyme, partial [Firmicutes bacterium]|nr:aminotransferase class I/II-fold pyridoxal phosphate-dependent enzyme [Bacillota bacterium]
MDLSERAKQFKISGIRVLFEKAEKYQNTINFGIGEPGFRPSQNIIDKTAWALNNGYTKYVSNAGIMPLREAIAKRSRELNGLDCDVSNVHVFVGATHALLMAMLSILNPGDDILIPCPYYAAYIGMVDMAEAHIVDVPVYDKDKF